MRALSLWQPWATLIAIGAKRIETRKWKPPMERGCSLQLAIHAAACWTGHQQRIASQGLFQRELARSGLDTTHIKRIQEGNPVPAAQCIPLGAIVAVAYVHGWEYTEAAEIFLTQEELAFGNYAPGRFAWLLGDVRPLAFPVACKGRQGIFTLPADVLKQVAAQLPDLKITEPTDA